MKTISFINKSEHNPYFNRPSHSNNHFYRLKVYLRYIEVIQPTLLTFLQQKIPTDKQGDPNLAAQHQVVGKQRYH